jgi:glycosyltransferase involved in cell wall biosynthesis
MSFRILVISAFLPFPPTNGFGMRVSALLQALRKQGVCIQLLCFGNASDLEQAAEMAKGMCDIEVIPHPIASMSQTKDYVRRIGTLASRMTHAVVRFRSEQMKQRISVRVKTERFDAIICETPYMFVNIPQDLEIPRVISSHNVEHNLLRRYLSVEKNPLKRCYASLEARKMAAWEHQVFARCQTAMACSEIDAAAIRRMSPELPVFVVPNAIDTATYTPSVSDDCSTVLYLGGMDWFPNRDAVEYFIGKILPKVRTSIPNVKFVVAGRSPSNAFRERFHNTPGIEFTGTLADLRPAIGAAAVVVVPLRIGSGTRFKILEAAAMEKPIVSTRLGAEGLNFIDGREIVLADDPKAFAHAVASLLADPNRRAELGRSARARVNRDYSFKALEESVENLLNQSGRDSGAIGLRTAAEHFRPQLPVAASPKAQAGG